ncbi:serine/threonine protein kinase [Streptomyces sp. TRM64462]|uniref:serine/threonine protein kinase n=1 Tax=Streptomyces sp. TRM64462 TaxID=2741726 RepID=UPI001585E8CD|nr:serine/threonine protein kinase [Streptomyces sp. TRM64462]
MDDYAGRVLADRYRLPLPPSGEDGDRDADDPYAPVAIRAFDTYSGQEVMVRRLPLPETVDAEVVDGDEGSYGGGSYGGGSYGDVYGRPQAVAAARAADPAVRRAVEAVQAAAQIPDHPRLDQVFDVFAEDGSLWIVSERVAARPLAALVREKPLSPYRAAEIASDLLTALRALHAHGWTHRNITVHTVLVCDDGRVVLSGLAAGAAEEALCGYAPVPLPDEELYGEPYEDPYEEPYGQAGEEGAYGDEGDAPGPVAPAPLPPGPPALPSGYEPQWVAQVADRIAEDAYGDEDADGDLGERGDPGDRPGSGGAPRVLLAGTWRDGPVSAGGGSSPYGNVSPYGGARAALRADAQRAGHPQQPTPQLPSQARSQEPQEPHEPPVPAPYRGPTTPLAAERARQARITVVGAVTERWAPEQAGPVHSTWQLAPPIGPATDLWALGALLFRVLQGHAPYPEDSAAELVQMVCAEPPAYAEDCGALRPVVESLLRQDPTERPDVEELRGWLRSLVRSAPEPEAGMGVVPMPAADAARLPIVRRRGDLERRRRGTGTPASGQGPGRHRHKKPKSKAKSRPKPRPEPGPGPRRGAATTAQSAARQEGRSPRALGRTLLLLIFLALAAAIAYAVLFMPEADSQDRSQSPTGSVVPSATAPSADPPASTPSGRAPSPAPGGSAPGSPAPSTNAGTPTAPAVADGYVVRDDPEGFRVAVDKTWRRSPINDIGQVRYNGGDFTLIVVPGRDTVRTSGSDPLEYQRGKERELQPWRDSSWATASGLRRVDVGRQAMAEGQFTWQDANGRQVYVRNLALLVGDRYHVVQVIGPESERDRVSEIYEQATKAYRATR